MFDGQFFPGQTIQFGDVPSGPVWPAATKLSTIVTRLGLTTNCKLILDAGDADSYTSGQSWLDQSGNDYDFFRGADGTVTTDDPAFNGSAGGLSSAEYWSFDGGDILRYDTTNETWMQNIHKNSAIFTLAIWIYVPTLAAARRMSGTSAGAVGNVGFSFFIDANDRPQLSIQNADGVDGAYSTGQTTLATVESAWNFVGVSIDEGSGAGTMRVNSDQLVLTPTYDTPSAAGATYAMEIGANGNATAPIASGTRIASFAAWEGVALSADQLAALFVATRPRFGV